jgi:hypothetical protein
MKKYFIAVAILNFIPSVTFASWWNPTTWGSTSDQIVSLNAQITSLQQTIAQQNSEISNLNTTITSLASATSSAPTTTSPKVTTVTKYLPCPAATVQPTTPVAVAPKPVPVQPAPTPTAPVVPPVTASSPNYSNYEPVPTSSFILNPSAYAGQPIVITGPILKFIPFGSSQYNAGFVEIGGGDSTDTVMLQVTSTAEYTTIVQQPTVLQEIDPGDTAIAYGIGSTTAQFQVLSATGVPYNTYFPVISLDRIDKCSLSLGCTENSPHIGIFAK